MDRRELLGLTPKLLLLTLLGAKGCLRVGRTSGGLFFEQEDVARIRNNARSPLLGHVFQEWVTRPDNESLEILRRPGETGDLISDLGGAFRRIEELSLVSLVTGDPANAALVLEGIDVALGLPKWDWFLDGDAEIGIMRASQGVGALLFAVEALGETIPDARKAEIHAAIADKGVEPCARAIRGMDHPEQVTGWRPDERHRERYPYDMSRWPRIFGGINLRAVPTSGLGLGALALEGRDDRATEWLELAVASAKTYLGRHEADGSYWEGISYVNYAFSTLFLFLEAYDRLRGDVNWLEYANFRGVNAYVAAMQMGRQPGSGEPDVVNFSDARTSTSVAVNAWLADHTKDPLAQYNVEHFSHTGYFADFLWYRPDRPSTPPPERLKNVRLDLDWIIARTGWDENDAVLAFRSGKPANHEHADRNSFMYKIHGERLLTDPFGASYDPRLPHWLLRQTEAHNAVLVNGRGHQYVDGSEGTNAGKASASILRYEDMGDTLWWVSDATEAYRMVTETVRLVRRSMLFAKPDWIVLYDELETTGAPARLDVRFFPDNRDGEAGVATGKDRFHITRPLATLDGRFASNVRVRGAHGTLDLPETHGLFPFVELRSRPATRVEIVSLLWASGSGQQREGGTISRRGQRWQIRMGDRTITLDSTSGLPAFELA
jgi:hypothetical protein